MPLVVEKGMREVLLVVEESKREALWKAVEVLWQGTEEINVEVESEEEGIAGLVEECKKNAL